MSYFSLILPVFFLESLLDLSVPVAVTPVAPRLPQEFIILLVHFDGLAVAVLEVIACTCKHDMDMGIVRVVVVDRVPVQFAALFLLQVIHNTTRPFAPISDMF
jgi:hypothetical protein